MTFENINADKKYIVYLRSKIKKLKEIINGISNEDKSFPLTCLTIMKKLCADSNICMEFMYFLSNQAHQHIVSNNENPNDLKNLNVN